MPATPSCPPIRALQQLVRKQLEAWETQLLATHLEQCERCMEILATFQEEATSGQAPSVVEEGAPVAASVAADPHGTWKDGLAPAAAAAQPAARAVATPEFIVPPIETPKSAPPPGLTDTNFDLVTPPELPPSAQPARPTSQPSADSTQQLLASIRLAAIANRTTIVHTPGEAKKAADRPVWMTVVQIMLLAALGWAVFWFGPSLYRAVKSRLNDGAEEGSSHQGRR
jgi:hypothetical protein